jgi:hypothetical protein
VLGEVGRRAHLFSWLRAPDAEPIDWLPVDAYYPRQRLVVLFDLERSPHAELYGRLIPAHGLRLLSLEPDALPPDPQRARIAVERRIGALRTAAPAPPPRERSPRESPVITAVASLIRPVAARPAPPPRPTKSRAAAAERAARLLAARREEPRQPVPAPPARAGHPGVIRLAGVASLLALGIVVIAVLARIVGL